MNANPDLNTLSELLVVELVKAMSLPEGRSANALVRRVFGRAVRLFASMGLELDGVVAEGGLSAGARWVLPRFALDCRAQGAERIPPEGPLVIAANHPGSFDSVAVSCHVARADYKVIIGDIPFFQHLPHIRARALFAPAPEDVSGRMRVVRESIRHLQGGGALLIFALGTMEADPDFMPAPEAEFGGWSHSLEIFLRRVPAAQILVTIVSGVIAERAFRHPLTRLRRARPDRQRLAFMLQMARQMASGGQTYNLRPRVTFGELVAGRSQAHVLSEVEAAAARTLARHQAWGP